MNTSFVLSEALRKVSSHKDRILRRLLIPVILLVAVGSVRYSSENVIVPLLIGLTHWFLYAAIAVSIHRIVLLDDSTASPLLPKTRIFRFMLYTLVVGIFCLPASLFSTGSVIGAILATLVVGYIASRFVLIFPAIAIESKLGILGSWNATHYHQITMFLVVGVIPSIVNFPARLLSGLPFMTIGVNLLYALTTVYLVATISVCYERIIVVGKFNQETD